MPCSLKYLCSKSDAYPQQPLGNDEIAVPAKAPDATARSIASRNATAHAHASEILSSIQQSPSLVIEIESQTQPYALKILYIQSASVIVMQPKKHIEKRNPTGTAFLSWSIKQPQNTKDTQ